MCVICEIYSSKQTHYVSLFTCGHLSVSGVIFVWIHFRLYLMRLVRNLNLIFFLSDSFFYNSNVTSVNELCADKRSLNMHPPIIRSRIIFIKQTCSQQHWLFDNLNWFCWSSHNIDTLPVLNEKKVENWKSRIIGNMNLVTNIMESCF